ncbi:unnamed protein product [Effrenium voratum]|nr:unnamed protein product [Effrenium voratum]
MGCFDLRGAESEKNSEIEMMNRSSAPLKLSPRFLSMLTQGESGEGLISRAHREMQRRAYERWCLQPWTSPEENWIQAERSLVRPCAPDCQSAGSVSEVCQAEKSEAGAGGAGAGAGGAGAGAGGAGAGGEKETETLRSLAEELAGERRRAQDLARRLSEAEARAAKLAAKLEQLAQPCAADASDFFELEHKSCPVGQTLPRFRKNVVCEEQSAMALPLPGELETPRQAAQQLFDVAPPVQRMTPTRGAMFSCKSSSQSALPASTQWTALRGELSSQVPQVPKLALSRLEPFSPKGDFSARDFSVRGDLSARSGCDRVLWPGSNMEPPPALPAPPAEHPLMTPRTGATPQPTPRTATPRAATPRTTPRATGVTRTRKAPFVPKLPLHKEEVFMLGTPRQPVQFMKGVSSPSPIHSRSPSPSSSEGSLDDADNWDRVASIETVASQEEVSMTYRSRSEKVLSERSNYSVCGLYGTGQDAEVQVLRKVIRDLEQQLQEGRPCCFHRCLVSASSDPKDQAQELAVWRGQGQ